MNDAAVAARLAEDAAVAEKKLREFFVPVSDVDVARICEAEEYSLFAGGKRVRPFLVLEFCRLFGGSEDAALCYAAGIEMMHTASLIHDDLPCMDDDDLRRGRPTSHKMFGEATAVLAGDALMIRAFDAVASAKTADPASALRAVSTLAHAAGSYGMIGGQTADLRGETERLSFDGLLKLHSMKTGAMITAACRLGCIAAGIGDEDPGMKAAEKYSAGIGLVFQIIDDVLDAESDPQTLGKSTGGDAEHNKTTFMTYMTPSEARRYAEKITLEATDALAFPGSGLLRDFAHYLLVRNK